MAYRDMMIWVGVSYPTIDCGPGLDWGELCFCGHCRPPGGGNRCYVHEAEYRGCCRRVPNLVPWAVPGETRVFLVHSEGCEEGHQGSLFGYYVLDRFEVVADNNTYHSLRDPDQIPWSEGLFREILRAVREENTTRPFWGQDRRRLKRAVEKQFEKRRDEFTRQVVQKQTETRRVSRRRRGGAEEHPFEELLKEILENLLEELLEALLESRIQKESGDPERIPWSDRVYREIRAGVYGDRDVASLWGTDRGSLERAVDEGYERRREEYQHWLQQDPDPPRPPRDGSPDSIFEALLEEVLEGLVEGVLEGTIEGWLEGALPGGRGQARRPEGGGTAAVLNSYHTAGEEERSCSPPNTGGRPPLPHKRTKPGAVYAVDPLTAAITDGFMAALVEEPAALRDGIEDEDIAHKEEIFRRVVRAVHRREENIVPDATERLPATLKGKVNKRRALVLFPRPFPVIQRCPKASFLGYLRVDGDRLLAEVAGTVGTANRLVKVPYYIEREARKSLTKAQLQAYLARELGVNQKLAGDFLEVLCDKAAAELEDGVRFVLSNFGSLAREPDGQVTFSAYKALRDRLEPPKEDQG